MLKHETKLIDPEADQIVAALSAATADANKRCRARLLKDDPAKWRKFARDAAAKSEGYAMFRGGKGGVPATQVLAAWWTDSIGRKHVVVRGRRVEHDEAKRLLQKDELDRRPPLLHAYPEYVCRRTLGKESQVICACGCGAVGTPESLGWMGETCGPCFDRREELGAAALRGNFAGVLYSHREPLGAVACSPDGTRVAAVEGESHASSHVSYWDTATRTRTTMKFSGMRTTDVAITTDGRHLLAVGMGTLIPEYGLFAAFDLGTDPPTRVDPARDTESPGWRIAALPDPTLAIRHRVNWPSHAGEFEVIRVPSGEPVRQLAPSEGVMGRFALSPDGTRLATCGAGMALYDLTDTGARAVATREAPHTPPQSVAFTAAGRLFGAFSGSVVEFDGAEVAAEAGLERRRGELLFETIRSLAADPAGEFIYVGTWQGKVCAFATDPLRLLAAFEWHLGAVTGLAVSADGSRLFSSGGDGCVKVWPIRDLLRVAG